MVWIAGRGTNRSCKSKPSCARIAAEAATAGAPNRRTWGSKRTRGESVGVIGMREAATAGASVSVSGILLMLLKFWVFRRLLQLLPVLPLRVRDLVQAATAGVRLLLLHLLVSRRLILRVGAAERCRFRCNNLVLVLEESELQ